MEVMFWLEAVTILLVETRVLFTKEVRISSHTYQMYQLKLILSHLDIAGVRGVGFVSSPLIGQRGTSMSSLMHLTDWMPTMMSMAGVEDSVLDQLDIDGVNQWKTLVYGDPPNRDVCLQLISRSVVLFSTHSLFKP